MAKTKEEYQEMFDWCAKHYWATNDWLSKFSDGKDKWPDHIIEQKKIDKAMYARIGTLIKAQIQEDTA